ncbi:ABC transporter substrate-binding protein [Anoxybacterium hadale]|uniref:ABC transporter substrate-binding protein n=1 Tax=Anoxybacterium hadale TaxID=3408580 RepID=A0ACD1A8E2_9FIRM|nr:ABC transporter substrate-binding protein [Clostridiales bacterium]
MISCEHEETLKFKGKDEYDVSIIRGRRMKKKLAILLVLVLLLSTLAGCGGGNGSGGDSESAEPFKVGAIYPLSGANALLGSQCLAAVKIAVDIVNANGGVQGRQVQLVSADAPDPTAATTEAGRLVDQQGVQVIFGSLASGNALAIAGVTEKSGVTLVESGGIADALTDSGFKNVFRILDKGGLRGAAGVTYTADVIAPMLNIAPKDLRVAIIHEESSYGTSVADGAENKIKELGLNLVAREHYNSTITDMSALVLKLKEAKPDVLFTVNYINDAILLVDTLKQYDAIPKVLMGCGAGTTDPNFAATIGADSDGFFCTDMPTNLPLDVFTDEAMKNVVSEFRERFRKEFPDMNNVSVAAEAAFAGSYTFMNNILPNAKTLDAAGIREAALTTKLDMTTLGFGWDLGDDGQNYAASANINQWQGGKVVTVSPDKLKNGEVINVPLPIAGQ